MALMGKKCGTTKAPCIAHTCRQIMSKFEKVYGL